MREIKFRAKIRGIVQPLDVVTIDFGNCVVCIVDPERCNQKTFDWSDIESLLQFTGLLDKNGREIYEGDIVKTCWQHNGNTNYDYEIIGKVRYDTELAQFIIWEINGGRVAQFYSYERDEYFEEETEVIGNIHENPELLEVRG